MRRRLIVVAVLAGLVAALSTVPPVAAAPGACATVQSGSLFAGDGSPIGAGYDEWGYNYQARLFNGPYCGTYRSAAWCEFLPDDNLTMKWNDAWLSNQDCDGDGLLDRHRGYPSYLGSGAWLTHHQWGEYVGDDGKTCRWSVFTKMVAAPADATRIGGRWYAASGAEIGLSWGEFAIIQDVFNDRCEGFHGISYLSPYRAGFGSYGPQQ